MKEEVGEVGKKLLEAVFQMTESWRTEYSAVEGSQLLTEG
jgi:hypothetical protein